jgi:D-glycerate 3-kinase
MPSELLAHAAPAILDLVAGSANGLARPFVLGLSGLQGSGKSTLAAAIQRLATRRRLPSVVLALDDFYLPLRTRKELAVHIHPLLRTRGVPGTHDIDALIGTLDALAHASPSQPARWPRFDKGRDDRLPPSRWHLASHAPELIVVEGWCVGVPPEDDAALRKPVNAFEREEDPRGVWRTWVNEKLRGYRRLWHRFDALAVLQAPGWEVVSHWRGQQEQSLHARGAPQAMDAAALARFLQHYERISRHALATLPARADLVLTLDADRHPALQA